MTDGAFRSMQHCMRLGGVFRDSFGSWHGGLYAGTLGGNAFLTEVQALQMGLLMVWRRHFRRVVCGSDCTKLVDALKRNRYDFHAYGSVLLDLHLLISREWDIWILHVPREANMPADFLAGLGAESQCPMTDLDTPPNSVLPFDLARNLIC